MRKERLVVVLIAWFWPFYWTHGQQSTINFKHLTVADGLSQSSVIAIAQDRQGILWFGTRDGLNKYDGNHISIYRNNIQDENSLSNNDILDLAVDQDGDIWIGTYNGLNHFDIETEKFTRYQKDLFDGNSISNNTIWSLEVLHSGEILIGTAEGLNTFDPSKGIFNKYFHNKEDRSSLPHDYVLDTYTDEKHQIWVATANGLAKILRNDEGDYKFLPVSLKSDNNLSDTDFIQAVTQDSSGHVWVGSRFNGLYKLSSEGDLIQHFIAGFSGTSIINNNVRALEINQNNRLWVGTYDGLSRLDSSGTFISCQNQSQNPNSISVNKVKTIFCSTDGSVWVGTYYGGVNMWNEANFNFTNIKNYGKGLGLAYNVVSSVIEDQDYMYFGTEGKGISVLNKANDEYHYIDEQTSNLSSSNIKALRWGERTGELWVCTFDAGLNLYDVEENKTLIILNQSTGLSHNSVYDALTLSDNLWLIGTFGGGLNLYNKDNGKVEWVMNNSNDSYSLSDDQVRSIMLDSRRNLWVATQNGLNRTSADQMAHGDFEFKRYFFDFESRSGEDVLAVFESQDNTIWVGTKESGLHYLKDGEFVSIDIFSDYPGTSNIIHSIEQDHSQTLWISSNNGVISFDPANNTKKLFEKSDGLVSNEFNNNASLYGANGVMYFGGPDGVSSFAPKKLKENAFVPNAVLTDLKINNKRIDPGDQTGILSKTLALTNDIELDYDQANFSLTFALPSFVNSGKNEFIYRMKGLEEDWNSSSIPEASYTIQNAGNYTFEVKGLNNDRYESAKITALHIYVHPAPWRSIWAFLAYGVVIAIALFMLLRMIKSKTQLQYELDLEHKINLQQQALNQAKLQFFTNISHEFRTPLTLILGPLDQLINEYRGGSAMFKKLKVMQQSANQLLKLINQLMDFRKIENKQAKLESAEGNIVKFIYEIFLSFKTLAKDGKFNYSFETSSDDVRIYYDRDKLERVLYNLLSNAFKFTKNEGSIAVTISESSDYVRVSVSDTGSGIEPENLDRIFERFYQATESSTKETSRGTGIGLALAKSIVDLHQGSLEVESEVGVGSTFVIRLKKGKSHLNESEIIQDFKDSEDFSNYRKSLEADIPELPTFEPDRLTKEANQSTVLVVEDNDHVRNFILELLNPTYNLLEAPNGKEGLALAIKEVPDLIISDVMMPQMDGIELCSEVKNNLKTSHIPFILLTARTSLIFKYEGLESGADDYINKPFNPRELQLKVKNLLQFVAGLKQKFKTEDGIKPSEITIASIDEELLGKAIQIVDENINNQFFDVNLFAKELGVSRTMLFTKVKAWTNMTPNDFIFSMRMKRAAQLLEQGKCSVSQISYKVGFKSPKYFSKSFNKYYSVSPKEFASKFT